MSIQDAFSLEGLPDSEEVRSLFQTGTNAAIDVGIALGKIKDQGLYRDDFDSFENYCKGAWKISLTLADELIELSRRCKEAIE